MTQQIKLEVTVEEINLILTVLGSMPYIQVHELIYKLQRQTGPQLVEQNRQEEQQQQHT